MIQKGDRRYEMLLRCGNVRELIDGGLPGCQFTVTMYNNVAIQANKPLRKTGRDPVIQGPIDTEFVVTEPLFERRRSVKHRISENEPKPAVTSIRIYCMDQILPVNLRTNQTPRIRMKKESPFACMRYRKLVGLDRDDEPVQNMVATARKPQVMTPVAKPSKVMSARK
jgi:hypothetical protein